MPHSSVSPVAVDGELVALGFEAFQALHPGWSREWKSPWSHFHSYNPAYYGRWSGCTLSILSSLTPMSYDDFDLTCCLPGEPTINYLCKEARASL